MAISLTQLAQNAADKIVQKPQLVLEIDGVSTIYGVGSIKKYIRVGDPDLYVGDDWVIGGFNGVDDQSDLISLDGTTTSIQQQLTPDKGGTSSISGIQISLLDKNNEITELITPGEVVDDILGRKAYVYLGYQDTAWPQDFIVIFSGVIDEVQAGTNIILNIAHPEQKKRASIYQKQNKHLAADANFRSKTIQSIKYQTRRDVSGVVTVRYLAGGTAGSENVVVVGTAISINIANGVSTASQIRNAIEKEPTATALINIGILSNQSSTAQTITAVISLLSDDTLTLDSTLGLLEPADSGTFRTYVRIDNELIEYTGIAGNVLTGCTREAFVDTDERTQGAQHVSGNEVTTFYRLQGNAIELALKILMSGGETYFASNVDIASINEVEELGSISNAVYFQGINVEDKYGLVSGDMISIIGDEYGANNVTDATIASVNVTTLGSYLVLATIVLSTNLTSSGTASFRSKYNVLPQGAGLEMGGDQIDVPEYERLRDLFSTSIFDYDFYLKDTVEGKDFIDTKVLFPTGGFSLPRKGKISMGYSSVPIAVSDIRALGSDNTARPIENKISRSTNKYFYNTIVFKYNDDPLDDKFLNGLVTADADSRGRIPVGNKVFTIEAPGLRPSGSTDSILTNISTKILDRYKFGAERITTQSFYGKTFNYDVGDVVLFGDNSLKIPDTKSGSREFNPRLFEIVNKSLDIKSGIVKLELVDTAYSAANARFGIFSPASIVGSGSTSNNIVITDSFGTEFPKKERYKWEDYIGELILVHNDDYSFAEEVTLGGFLAGNDYIMTVSPALSSPPSADYLVEVVNYPTSTDPLVDVLYKNVFCFFDPQVQIVTGTNNFSFTVSGGDALKFFVGCAVVVHTDDPEDGWTQSSDETTVASIIGTTITVVDDLGFTPSSSHFVDLLGFSNDEGSPYRYY